MNFTRNTASAELIISTCSNVDCPWHEPLRYGEISSFGEPVPKEKTNGSITYIQESNPSEKFLPSKLENPAKCNHGMPFTPTAQTAVNVGITLKCSECRKPCVLYTKKKLANANMAMKRIFNNFQYVCGTVFHNIPIDERNRDTLILELLYCWENLSCTSPIKIPYYSSKIFLKICYHCGSSKRLLPSDPVFYPQCDRCQSKEQQRVAKWKQVVSSDLGKSKKQKTCLIELFH